MTARVPDAPLGPGAAPAEPPVPEIPDAAPAPAGWSSVAVTLGLFALFWVAFAILAAARPGPVLPETFDDMSDLLTTGGAIVAVVFGTLRLAQRPAVVAEGRTVSVGVAFILYGSVVLHFGRLFPVGGSEGPEVLGYFSEATLVAVFGLLVWSGVTSRRSPLRPLAGAGVLTVAVLALTAVLQLVPDVARALELAIVPTPDVGGTGAGQLLLAGAWLVVAALTLRESGGHRVDVAVGIVALGLAQARVALVFPDTGTSVWVLASHLFQLAALAFALGVVATEFGRQAGHQQDELIDSRLKLRTDGARRQARQTVEAGRRHDLRSALFVLDGAARTLADRAGDLSPEDRMSLGKMLTAALEQLGAMVDLRIEESQDLALDDLARSVVHAEQRLGTPVTTAVPGGLRAAGRAADVAAVLRTVIHSAQHRSGGAPVVVGGESRISAVALLVDPAGLGEGPFSWNWTAVDAQEMSEVSREEGEALDLYVAARLMAEQGGDLWIARHPGGLVSFAVRLPASRPSPPEEDR